MNDKKEVPPAAAQAAAPVTPAMAPATPKAVPVEQLPRSVQWIIGRVPPQDWRFVETLVCRLPFTRDLVNAIQFADTVWFHARNAEFRTLDRITGAEMDGFRAELDAAAQKIVSVTVALAGRAGLTETIQRYRRLLRRYGVSANPGKASPAPGAAAPLAEVAA